MNYIYEKNMIRNMHVYDHYKCSISGILEIKVIYMPSECFNINDGNY